MIGKASSPNHDSALLVIAKDSDGFGLSINGIVLLLCGFAESGTFVLAEMLSNINRYKEHKIAIANHEITIFPIDFFYVVNYIIQKQEFFCIEAVFEFYFEVDTEKKAKIKDCMLKTFCLYDRKTRKRTDILYKIEDLIKRKKT
ncbi:hypothetical protein MBAV_000971 [Candidatus Magnetobacterium bavaricum]|uniref:Uncharacterized protein n=1 Tax=Candidatus Magnetobacterium bavaricum TaxID=29290 RepID=A0A0F3GY94_9BACT|nr:hypothetical protein MBAV_000971 [Candidatus Magnetobacterium bavaricum]